MISFRLLNSRLVLYYLIEPCFFYIRHFFEMVSLVASSVQRGPGIYIHVEEKAKIPQNCYILIHYREVVSYD